jgi:hypothetical protein
MGKGVTLRYGIILEAVQLTVKEYLLNKKKTFDIMAGVKPTNSCNSLFKKLDLTCAI